MLHPLRRVGQSLLLSFLMLTPMLQDQLTTATLVGTVSDSTGAVIPRAKVTVVNVDTHDTQSVPTNGSGEYRIDLLPVGTYTMTVESATFKKFVQNNIVLTVNQQARVNGVMEPGTRS